MKPVDFSNMIASEMDKVMNSDENKQIFSTSSMIEKLAFKKVSEQEEVTDVEKEFEFAMTKKASCCDCADAKDTACKCECHEKKEEKEEKKSEASLVSTSVHALLKISADLDDAGFEKLSAASVMLANKLIVEAKAKKSDKDSKKSDKKSKEDKSKSKKMTMKERMDKMRKMKGDKKSSKDSKKK